MTGSPVVLACQVCNYQTKPGTPATAAHALKQHSCQVHLQLAERAAKAQIARAMIDRRPKVCEHAGKHPHGSVNCYTMDRCRCLPCAAAAQDARRKRARGIAYGTWQPYVDVEPVREHIRMLMEHGIGWKRIADLAGVSQNAVNSALYRRSGKKNQSRRINARSAAAILKIQPTWELLSPDAHVNPTGTERRIQALVSIGWSQADLAKQLGLHRDALHVGRRAGTPITRRNADRIAELYRQLQDTPGPSLHARRWAERHGWLGPDWWDEDTIDDPYHIPPVHETKPDPRSVDWAAVELAVQGKPHRILTDAERIEAVARVPHLGLNEASRVLRIRDLTIKKIRADLAARMDVAS